MRIRPYQPEVDLPIVLAFLAEVERQTGIPPLGESKFVDLTGPSQGSGFIGGAEGIDAYAHVLHHTASHLTEMEVVAAPDTSDDDLASLAAAVRESSAHRMLWWTFGETRAAAFGQARLDLYRQLHKLTGPLPLTEPRLDGGEARVRPFQPGVDDEVWLEVNNAAFAGHPENGGWSLGDLEDRLARDWFEAQGFRLSWVGDRLAGFCWTKRHRHDVGEIYVIAVHPDFQGRGLGRQIVIEALWYLADAGCTTGMLYVDTANRSALRLYQSLGFELVRVDRCFAVPKGWPPDPQ